MSQYRVALHRRNRQRTQRQQVDRAYFDTVHGRRVFADEHILRRVFARQRQIVRELQQQELRRRQLWKENHARMQADAARRRKAQELAERVQQWADAAKPDYDRIMGNGKLGMGGPLSW